MTNGEREYSHLSFSGRPRIIFTASGDSDTKCAGSGRRTAAPSKRRQWRRISPDGLWLACVVETANLGSLPAAASVSNGCLKWSMWRARRLPDSRSVVVHARPDPAIEADWWIVPMDGGSPTNTGLVQRFREAGMFTVPTGAAWVDDSLVFSAAGAQQGVGLYRQRIASSTFQPAGAPERLTAGSESAWLPTAAAGRLAFLSSRADANLWSVALDEAASRAVRCAG